MTRLRKLVIPEREVQASIVEYFAAVYKIELHRRNTGAVPASYKGKDRFIRFSKPGMADLWGIEPGTGRHIEIETKRKGKTPTEKQSLWLEWCQAQGAIAFYADSLDMAIAEYERQRKGPEPKP